MRHLFIYQPTQTVAAEASEFGTRIQDWGDEHLYELNESPHDNDDLRDWCHETANETRSILRYRMVDKPSQRVFFEDMYDDSPLSNIVTGMTPGGDIRKYMNNRYTLGTDSAIDCKLRHTCFPDITGFEPFPMWAIQELLSKGICSAGMNDSPRYPKAERILLWSDIVQEKWGCRTGALGTMHFDNSSAGCNGFVIYDADETIREWAADRWTTNPSHPYMRPYEFNLCDLSDSALDTDAAIRIWFD